MTKKFLAGMLGGTLIFASSLGFYMSTAFAKISSKSFATVLDMKNDWRQVADQLGINGDQLRALREQEMTEGLAERSSLDVKVVDELIKDGYNPRDIMIAGRLAKASNKSVKTVLGKKKINNRWSDVAKDLGVDVRSIMSPRDEFESEF